MNVGIGTVYSDDEPKILEPVISILSNEPLTRQQALSKGISKDQLSDAIDAGYVVEWDTCVEEPILYVPEKPSEWKAEKYVYDWVNQHNYEEVVLEVIKDRSRFGSKFSNMLEFLQSFDTGKIKYWDPISFYNTLTNLYNRGELEQFEYLRDKLPLVEEARTAPIDQVDIDLVGARELVRLNLLSPVNKELGVYKHAYCSFVENQLRENGIPLESLMVEKVDFNSFKKNSEEKKDFLVRDLGIVDESGSFTDYGKSVVDTLCKCTVDLRDTEKATEILIDKWMQTALKQTKPLDRARYFLKVYRMSKKSIGTDSTVQKFVAKEVKKEEDNLDTRLSRVKHKFKDEEKFKEVYNKIAVHVDDPKSCPYKAIIDDVKYSRATGWHSFGGNDAATIMEWARSLIGLDGKEDSKEKPIPQEPQHRNQWKYNSAIDSMCFAISECNPDDILRFSKVLSAIETPLRDEYDPLQRAVLIFKKAGAKNAERILSKQIAKDFYAHLKSKRKNEIKAAEDLSKFILSGGNIEDLDAIGGKEFSKDMLFLGSTKSRKHMHNDGGGLIAEAADKLEYYVTRNGIVPKK